MSGIYAEYTLPINGAATDFIHGDHCGVFFVKADMLQGGVVNNSATGKIRIEWSNDGERWMTIADGLRNLPYSFAGASVNAVARYFRATGTATGADSVKIYVRLENIGIPGIPQSMISNLRFFDRLRVINQSLVETATLEGDSYRIYAFFGDKSNLADLGDDFPAIPAGGNAWISIEYSSTKLTAIVNRVLALFAGAGLKYTAYAPGSPFTGAGDPIQVRNLENNLAATDPPDAVARYLGNATPPQFTGASEIDFAVVPKESGGAGSSGGGRLPEEQFIIPPLGGATLVQIYNPSNAAAEVRFEIQIVETSP